MSTNSCSKRITYLIGFIVVLFIVITNYLLNLFANFSSRSLPTFLEEKAYLLIVIPVILIIFMVLLMMIDHYMKTPRKSKTTAHFKKMDSEEYDVFISYSPQDKEWVDNDLIPWLRNHGLTVLTNDEFEAGRFTIEQIEDGVSLSKRVVAVFTPDYFNDDWCALGNLMTQVLDPAARQRKLIPVLHKTTDIPLRLAGLYYRDLRTNDDSAWERLIQDLI